LSFPNALIPGQNHPGQAGIQKKPVLKALIHYWIPAESMPE
jgi:hypothetical protein